MEDGMAQRPAAAKAADEVSSRPAAAEPII